MFSIHTAVVGGILKRQFALLFEPVQLDRSNAIPHLTDFGTPHCLGESVLKFFAGSGL